MHIKNFLPALKMRSRSRPFPSIRSLARRIFGVLCWLMTILLPAMCIWFVLHSIIMIGTVKETSMTPSIQDGAIYIANRLSYVASSPEHGDVVICDFDGMPVIKRIIGVPGDEISFKDGYVVLNGTTLLEEYVASDNYTWCEETFVVPKGMYFILGDNREGSYDSRDSIDPYIYRTDIKARVLCGMNSYKKPFACNKITIWRLE